MRLRSTALVPLVSLGVLVGPLSPAPAATKKSCHTAGKKVLKRKGAVVVYRYDDADMGGIYVACSTRYGRRARLAVDSSAFVDESFTVKRIVIGATRVTMTYTVEYSDGADRYVAKANLRTGGVSESSTEF